MTQILSMFVKGETEVTIGETKLINNLKQQFNNKKTFTKKSLKHFENSFPTCTAAMHFI